MALSIDQSFRAGMRQAVPVVLGYIPIGFAYGVLGAGAGVPTWAIVAMSLVVFAGSAQFIAVSLLDQGASAATLVLTTALVNARHVLYGSALSPYLRPMGKGRLAWLAAELTDETFVMASRAAAGRRRSLSFSFLAGLNATAQISWVAGSFAGAFAGELIADPATIGLDYALISMFLGLLALQIHGPRELAIAFVGGLVSVGFWFADLPTLGVIVATLLASAAGLYVPGDGRGARSELPNGPAQPPAASAATEGP